MAGSKGNLWSILSAGRTFNYFLGIQTPSLNKGNEDMWYLAKHSYLSFLLLPSL